MQSCSKTPLLNTDRRSKPNNRPDLITVALNVASNGSTATFFNLLINLIIIRHVTNFEDTRTIHFPLTASRAAPGVCEAW